MSIRLLIADDQALVRAGFRKILESEPGLDVVAEAEDGLSAVEATARHRPDVVLMDIRMPRLDGIAATRRILEQNADRLRVLMLTTYGLDEYVYEALRAGASGFLLKDVSPERLVDAVKVIASGDALLDPSVTRAVIEEFIAPRPDQAQTGNRAGASDRARARRAGAAHAREIQRRDRADARCQ